MDQGDYHPGAAVERQLPRLTRRSLRRKEVAFIAGEERSSVEVEPVDDGRIMHGRYIRPGVRPLLSVSRVNKFAPYLTERQLSRGKVRTARSWGRMIAMLKDTGLTLEEFVETLTPEELVHGKLKDKDGKFRGRPPAWVPAEFHRACIRELMRRGKRLWQESYLDAIETMVKVAKGEVKGVTGADRLRAAQFIVERIEGKVPERLEVVDDSPWQQIIEGIVMEVPEAVTEAGSSRRELVQVIDGVINEPQPPTVPTRTPPTAARRRPRGDRG